VGVHHCQFTQGYIYDTVDCQLGDDGAKMRVYDGKSKAKLGTKKNPAVVTVQTEERRKDVAAIRHLWRCP